MKQNYLPWFLLFCAVGLSTTAAYYSVVGLSIVFIGAAIPVIVMGSFLEISKIAIATYLHNAWKNTYTLLKVYLTIALVVLSVITSIGIYGLLSTGFQQNIAKLEISGKQVKNIEVKKQRFEDIKLDLEQEKTNLDKDISQLRNALSTNTTTQSVDRKTGQVVTKANNANRKSFEIQLTSAQANKDKISTKIDALNDSITNLDLKILDMESTATESNELGAVQYVSEVTGANLQTVANWFIFLLIFVFDPLAITLVIATNQSFEQKKPKLNIYGEPKTHLQKEADRVWEKVAELKDKGVFTEATEEEKLDEPSALANSQYRNEYLTEDEKTRIQREIELVKNSNTSSKKKGIILQDLQNQLNDIDNQITY
jgi:hypothetical protein